MRRWRLSAWVVLTATCVMVPTTREAHARGEYVNQIPNGGFYTCDTCHIGRRRDEVFNVFGDQILNALDGTTVLWEDVYDLDADGDGFSNGVELGDPLGEFFPGSSPAGPYFSDPWDENSVPFCGNGERDSIAPVSEQCDGEVETTCEVIGGVASERPACTEFCTLDYDSCVTFPEPDMGMPPDEDMGMQVEDMGSPPSDMGAVSDMGSPPVDMGSVEVDMNPPPVDMDSTLESSGDMAAGDIPNYQLEGEPFMCANAVRGNGSVPMPRVFWVLFALFGIRRLRR